MGVIQDGPHNGAMIQVIARVHLQDREITMLKTIAVSTVALLAATTAVPTAHASTIGDVFYIALENHNATQPSSYTGTAAIYGNSAAPFINSLITPGNPNAAMVSYATNYNNVSAGGATIHPSEPNYVWDESGSAANNGNPINLGSDADPYANLLTTGPNAGKYANISTNPNLSGLLQSKGISWTSYQEDIDLAGSNGANFTNAANRTSGVTLTNTVVGSGQNVVPLTSFSGTSATYTNAYNGSNQYNYAPKHDGQLFFADTNGGNNGGPSNSEAGHYAPLQQLASDLAANTVSRYNWITPDQFNDMHSSLNTPFTYNGVTYAAHSDAESIALGDNFLSQIVPLIEASQAFQNNGEIVIWNDENEGDTLATASQFTGVEIIISPLAKGNAYTNTITYNHSSDLKTLQEIFGVDNVALGAAATSNDLSDLYKANTVPVPEPATWAMMLAGFGLVGSAMRRRGKSVAA
jgi:hypothetical protein